MSDSGKLRERKEFDDEAAESKNERYLVLYNDDYHTFEYVIKCLVDICKLDALQAEQCTFIVHFKGKCDVKKGSYGYLKPFREALVRKGLKVTIE